MRHPNPHPPSPPPITRSPQIPTVSPELPAAERPFCQGKWTCRGDLQSGGRPPLPADAREGRAGAVPRLDHSPMSAGLRVGGRPRRPEPPGLPLPPARPAPTLRGLRPLNFTSSGQKARGTRDGGRRRPPKTYHGPGGKQGLNIHPSHTYTAQPPRLGGNKTRRKAGAGRASLVPVPNRRTEREGGGGAARAADPRARTRGARGRTRVRGRRGFPPARAASPTWL